MARAAPSSYGRAADAAAQHVTTCALLDFQFERLGDVQQLCGASFGLGAHRPARDSATGT